MEATINDATKNESCNVVFESSIDEWSEVNSSFDRGVLKIAYHGPNRNKMFIGKKALNDATKSVYNCPNVCNYSRDTDSIGAHDVDIVRKNGEVRMVNVTTPVGVVPESANVWWTEVAEANGDVHEYLCTDILIWKRQEAYEHLKENGITDESMEIRIISGNKKEDGLYHIDRFEFLAFCLLESAPPCFESAGIELFTLNDFRAKYVQMMEDVKREFSTVITASADDIHTQSCSKGGTCELDVNELMIKYSLSAEDITFDTTDMTLDEIEHKFAEIKAAKDGSTHFNGADEGEEAAGDAANGAPEDGESGSGDNTNHAGEGHIEGDDPAKSKQDYSLTASQFMSELYDALDAVRYSDPYWGEITKYCYMDYDAALNEVYVIDMEDYRLYGMPFSMNGDKVVIDFAKCKRKKTCYVDFDEGEAAFTENKAFANLIPKLHEKFKALGEELSSLKAFKQRVDDQVRKEKVNEVFAKFVDLEGNSDFKALKENYGDMTESQIEEKCFAIRGRNMPTNFSLENPAKPIRLPVDAQVRKDSDEPYGGVFAKYGIGSR